MDVIETIDLEVCIDCLLLIANGEGVMDADGNDITDEHAELVAARWPANLYTLAPDCPEDCEGSFSWSDCDGCGSTLGGDRHPVAALQIVPLALF